MTSVPIGSVWTVPQLGSAVLVTLGPFGAADKQEYLVTPLYPKDYPGFVRSQIDLLIDPPEGPFDTTTFAAVWNARPMLASDFGLSLGLLASPALEAVKDVYWATLNDHSLKQDRRLGRFQFLRRKRIIRFQEDELSRWAPLSGRVWDDDPEPVTPQQTAESAEEIADHWQLIHDRVVGNVYYHSCPAVHVSATVDELRLARQTVDNVLRWTGEHDLGLLLNVNTSFAVPMHARFHMSNLAVPDLWWSTESVSVLNITLDAVDRSRTLPAEAVEAAEMSVAA